MKNLLTLSVLINLFLFAQKSNAATYYFSATDGDDSRTSAQAQSSSTPWKTIDKLNSVFSTIQPGDQILFKSGDIFYGGISVTKSGSSSSPITFGSYGSGAKPVITGFYTISSWTSIGNGLYEAAVPAGLSTLNMVAMDGNFQAIGRYPKLSTANSGYLALQSHSGTSSITSNAIGSAPNFSGGQVVHRAARWVIERGTITSQTGTTVSYTPIAGPQGSPYQATNGNGLFFQNHPNACTVLGEWAYSSSTHKITMYFGSAPTAHTVQASSIENLISASSRSYITFTNIEFRGSNSDNVSLSGCNNIVFNGVSITYSGKNGINTVGGGSSNIKISNSIINRTNNNGIYSRGSSSWTISGNTFTDIAVVAGMGDGGDGQYEAMSNIGSNSTIELNTVTRVGYIGVHFGGSNVIIDKNLFDGFCLVKDDGGAIYTFHTAGSGNKITNNICLNGKGALPGITSTYVGANGIYMDDDATGVEIAGNTVANSNVGMQLHNCTNINFHDNTLYNTLWQIRLNNDASTTSSLSNNNNIVFAKTANQYLIFSSTSSVSGMFSSANNNYYCRPLNESSSFSLNSSVTNLAGWKSSTGKETSSKVSPMTLSDTTKIRFEYNASTSTKTVNLGATYMDATGKNYVGTVTLAPYTSAVLMYVSGTVANQPPVANAGSNQTITLPSNSVTLDGSNSKDPDGSITSYAWSKVSGPAQGTIANASVVSTTATNLTQGTYVFKLTVTDNGGATGSDSIVITVNGVPNQPPVANAGANQTIVLPTNSVILDGSASSDPDGSISSYAWTKSSGPSQGTISSAANATTTVTNLVQGTYVFKLTVKDNGNVTAADSIIVTVNGVANQLPVANAGNNQTITLPSNSVTLNGSASSDPDGNISSYAWSKSSGPSQGTLTSATSATTTVTNLVQGTYVFKLTVKDNANGTAADSVIITVNAAVNQLPIANAGANQTITLPANSVTLNGSASSDPGGSISSYTWSKSSGPSQGTITTTTSAVTTVTNLVQGTYIFKLTVKDNSNATTADSITVIVNAAANRPPVANAGSNQTITLPSNSVNLNGSASSDPDGSVSSYTWSKSSGPSQGSIANAASAITTVTNLVQGTYIFKLIVKDNSNATAADSITVIVNAAANQPPFANAGSNQTITLPVNSVSLNGSASSDPDGSISSYTWSKSSGPAQGNITNSASVATTVTNLVQGVYVFKLTVRDNNNANSSDSIVITVNAAVNQSPVANAGANQTITLPTNSVTLSGSASSDPDGSITSYLWAKLSGGTASISNANSVSTTISNLQEGQYTFELTVTDNAGASSKKTVRVTVLNPADQNPVANAGSPQTLTLPVNSTTLNGSSSLDPDGTISSFVWSKTSGPGQGNIVSANQSITVIDNLAEGVYIFKLTVTDNDGNTSSDSVTITVSKAPNQSPVAKAGASQTITLPVNTATLDGSASSDTDGSIASYKWAKLNGGAATIADNAASTTTVTGLVAGQYTFELTVTDDEGAVSKVQVKVIVNAASNQSPVANAGSNQTITLPVNTVSLDGSASTDPDGTIVSYKWAKISGTGSAISGQNTALATVSGLQKGSYVFELTVTDNRGASTKAQVKITVNAATNQSPVANAGTSQTIILPANTATLDGSASSDPDGRIVSYKWVKISGGSATITNNASAKTTITGLAAGQYSFELTVTDNNGAVSKAQVKITVNAAANQSPIANAGSNMTITVPTDSVRLDGSKSSDPDGTIVSYNWVKIAGGSGTIKNPNTASSSVSGLSAGQYTFELTVTDNKGASSKAQVKVTVNETPNQSPVANAGANQTLPFGTTSTILDGSKSSDPDGNISSYSWALVSGADVTISNNNSATPAISDLQGGQYVFELTVTDDKGATSKAQVKIIVNLNSNQPPVANAGSNQVITLPVSSTRLDGVRSSDPDGTIVSYNWTRVSGPSAITITNVNTSTPIVSNLTEGQYTFELTVTDNRGASTKAQVKITVQKEADNQLPIADAGADQNIILPVVHNAKLAANGIRLDGNRSFDPDGVIVSYSWMKIDGPSAVSITDVNTATPTVSGLEPGQYTFELTVTDNKGAISKSQVTIYVRTSPGQPPVADAGKDIIIISPESTATLSGSASYDYTGDALSYSWEQVHGPSNSSVPSLNSSAIAVTDLKAGEYIFKLTVTNSRGIASSDEVKVTVVDKTGMFAQMELYPNPASDIVNAKIMSDSIGVVVLNIYDMNGRQVKKVELNKQLVDNLRQQVQRRDVNNTQPSTSQAYFTLPVNVSSLGKGVYVIESIIDKRVRVTSKFVKL